MRVALQKDGELNTPEDKLREHMKESVPCRIQARAKRHPHLRSSCRWRQSTQGSKRNIERESSFAEAVAMVSCQFLHGQGNVPGTTSSEICRRKLLVSDTRERRIQSPRTVTLIRLCPYTTFARTDARSEP
jgi:hypothetical protein